MTFPACAPPLIVKVRMRATESEIVNGRDYSNTKYNAIVLSTLQEK
jgi:hypothetical protein